MKNDFTRKYLFWVGGGVTLLAGIITWYLATDSLYGQHQSQKNKVKSGFSTADGIQNQKNHPTPDMIQALAEQTKELSERLGKTMKSVRQRQETLLVWPPVSERFNKEITDKTKDKSIESVPEGDEISPDAREDYRNYVKQELTKLAKIVGAKWHPGESRGDGAGPGDEKAKKSSEPDALVRWEGQDQTILENRLKPVTGDTTPNTRPILYAQEDLWIYQTLLTILAKTNAGATGNYNAAVKEIRALRIGQDFEPRSKSAGFDELGKGGASKGSGIDDLTPTPLPQPDASDGGEAAAGKVDAALKYADKRYVDAEGKPLTGQRLLDLKSREFKRMPVLMRLTIDQRKLTELLIQCANSPLTVEVKQVSAQADDSVTAARDDQPEAKKEADQKTPVWDVEVEIYGVVYIFNPYDPKKFEQPSGGIKEEGEKKEGE